MMADPQSMLSVLQHADSFFPGGTTASSFGLEALVQDQLVHTHSEVEAFVQAQLRFRWARFDRPVLVAASQAANDLDRLTQVDLLVDAQSLCEEARTASCRTGKALLGVHVKLKTRGAQGYQQRINDSGAVGHHSVVQGLTWTQSGLTASSIEMMSAHMFCVGLAGAALRLGLIGHIGAQTILTNTRSVAAGILSRPPEGLDSLSTFAPQQEIAMMRHETMSHRLFIN